MNFAFLIMGEFDAAKDRATLPDGTVKVVGVSSVEEACMAAQALVASGTQCIELCGAFGEMGARKVIEATGNKIPIGFVTHLPEQNGIFQAVFP